MAGGGDLLRGSCGRPGFEGAHGREGQPARRRRGDPASAVVGADTPGGNGFAGERRRPTPASVRVPAALGAGSGAERAGTIGRAGGRPSHDRSRGSREATGAGDKGCGRITGAVRAARSQECAGGSATTDAIRRGREYGGTATGAGQGWCRRRHAVRSEHHGAAGCGGRDDRLRRRRRRKRGNGGRSGGDRSAH